MEEVAQVWTAVALPDAALWIWQAGAAGFIVAVLRTFMLVGVVLGTLKISGDASYALVRLFVPAESIWTASSQGPQDTAWLLVYTLQLPLWHHSPLMLLLWWEQVLAASLLHAFLLQMVGSEEAAHLPSAVMRKMVYDPGYVDRRIHGLTEVSTHVLLVLAYIGVHGMNAEEMYWCGVMFCFNELLAMFLCARAYAAASLLPDPWEISQPYLHGENASDCTEHEACSICLDQLCTTAAALVARRQATPRGLNLAAGRAKQRFNTSATRTVYDTKRWIARTSCGHEFHAECLGESAMLHPACPLCRKSFGDDFFSELVHLDERETHQLFFMFRGALIGASLLMVSYVLTMASSDFQTGLRRGLAAFLPMMGYLLMRGEIVL